ncbi:SMI1/KNR4 family protein [Photorhabdus sp. SF281]|uniref:SMI1/KNR4 family protein n=1 Tax=Photorhabdus sp. SF281 TaxID=3459527 RepID=UPI004044D65F
MIIEDVDKAIEIINENIELADFEGPKDENLIIAAEKILGLNFPIAYRHFLEMLGCGDIAGQEFYGLIKPNFIDSGIPDAVWITMQERNNSNLPNNYLIICSTGDGGYVVLDCSNTNKEEGVIEQWDPGVKNHLYAFKPLASNFGEFFYTKIQSAVG